MYNRRRTNIIGYFSQIFFKKYFWFIAIILLIFMTSIPIIPECALGILIIAEAACCNAVVVDDWDGCNCGAWGDVSEGCQFDTHKNIDYNYLKHKIVSEIKQQILQNRHQFLTPIL